MSKRCFDAEGGFCYEEKFSYNARNQVILRTDERGHNTHFKYDVAGNCVLEEGPYPGVKRRRLFNLSNNCYYEREELPEGEISVKHDELDYCQKVVAQYDDLGGVTSYRYDGLDKIQEIIHPVVPILGGKFAFREETSYDLFGNRRYYVDPAGRVFRGIYNIFGKPLSLSSSEGEERYFYRPNGLLERIAYRDGQVAKIHEDPRGRMLFKGLYSKEGALLKEEHWVYKGSLCLKYVDPEGILTEWIYDAAGRIIEEKKGRCRNRFEYGALGLAERVFFYDGEELLKIEEKVHNPLKEVIEERILDKEGDLVFSKKYSYDAFGNCVLEEVGNQKTERRFDSKGRLVFEFKEGVETHYFFNKEMHANGIKCRTMTTVDPEGSHKKEWCDALDRVFHVEFVNPFGEKIYDEKIFYNGEGKIVRRERDPGKGADLEKTHWNYNERGYLVEKIEGVGSCYEARTRFEYNASGQRSALIKASGVRIEMAYDVRGHLTSYVSSDGTIDILFKRDLMGRVLSVKDKNHVVERMYSREGFLEEEKTDDLSVKFERDAFNRITKVAALGVTGLLSYSPAGVERAELSARGESLFYSVNERNEAAHILKETFGGVERSYARDAWGRITSFKDPYFERDVISYNKRGSPASWSEKTPFGERESAFAYDYQNHLISEGEKTYGYDNIGRRTEKNGATILLSPLGYQTEIDGERFEYDMDGRLVSFRGFSYTYDAYDQLLSVKKGDDLLLQCTYDGLHRLVTIQRSFHKEQILYQESLDIGTVVNGECLHFRLLGTRGRGAEIGEALLFYLNRGLCTPLDDPLGNIIGVVSRERLMHKVRYGAFGEIIEGSTEGMPWSFMGKRQLTEDLIHFGLRTYSSFLGTWLTKDPLGERGGSYAYIFCENNPLRNSDLFGLMPCNRPATNINVDYDRWTEYTSLFRRRLLHCTFYGTDDQGMILPGRVHTSFLDDPDPSTYFTQGQQIPNLLVTYINGIKTSLEYAQETAKIFCERLGIIEGAPVQINGIYNPHNSNNFSVFSRLIEERSFAAIMPACSQLINTWKEYLSPGGQLDPERRVFHICHSEGALITRNALAKMNADGDRDIAKRIFICSLAGAARIDPLGCGGIVDNITFDFVPYFDIEYHPRCEEVENFRFSGKIKDLFFGAHESREPIYSYFLDTNWSSFRERGDFGGVKMCRRISFFSPSRSYNPYHREEY